MGPLPELRLVLNDPWDPTKSTSRYYHCQNKLPVRERCEWWFFLFSKYIQTKNIPTNPTYNIISFITHIWCSWLWIFFKNFCCFHEIFKEICYSFEFSCQRSRFVEFFGFFFGKNLNFDWFWSKLKIGINLRPERRLNPFLKSVTAPKISFLSDSQN